VNPEIEVFWRLRQATPTQRADIVLGLCEHQEDAVDLSFHNYNLAADLREIDLSAEKLRTRIDSLSESLPRPRWWDSTQERPRLCLRLPGAKLDKANLDGVILEAAQLNGAHIKHASLVGAELLNARLSEADLRKADLTDGDLSGAILNNVKLQGTILRNTMLSGTSLRGAVLKSADLNSATLYCADLRGADLRGVDFTGVKDMSYACLGEADLEGTKLNWDKLSRELGDEREAKRERTSVAYAKAKTAYRILKRNFAHLGQYHEASLAYRKERRMEKLEELWAAREALKRHEWIRAIDQYSKHWKDYFIELICDYGESVGRVFFTLSMVLLGFALLYGIFAGVWGPPVLIGEWHYRFITRVPVDLLFFSLGSMVTQIPAGLDPDTTVCMRIMVPLQAFLGICLAGLLGFVAGNRISRSR
jgi:uncharacterized protein YjbI with pentapeptide repeats